VVAGLAVSSLLIPQVYLIIFLYYFANQIPCLLRHESYTASVIILGK
jgi:hypothetical protein